MHYSVFLNSIDACLLANLYLECINSIKATKDIQVQITAGVGVCGGFLGIMMF